MNNEREIKFRIWDDQLEKIIIMPSINSFRSSHLPSEAGTPVDYEITSGIVEKTIQENSNYTNICNDMEIMQFTGLLDKNGKEIYESDLIKVVDMKDDTIGMENNIYIVEFDRDQFCITTQQNGYHETIPRENAIEVIGNIYENPELEKNHY
jgi:uncharacterized phage protein (TIGR01671 family)